MILGVPLGIQKPHSDMEARQSGLVHRRHLRRGELLPDAGGDAVDLDHAGARLRHGGDRIEIIMSICPATKSCMAGPVPR